MVDPDLYRHCARMVRAATSLEDALAAYALLDRTDLAATLTLAAVQGGVVVPLPGLTKVLVGDIVPAEEVTGEMGAVLAAQVHEAAHGLANAAADYEAAYGPPESASAAAVAAIAAEAGVTEAEVRG